MNSQASECTLFEYRHFHDTIESTPEDCATFERQCSKQEQEILALFPSGSYLSQPSIRRAYSRRYGRDLAIASCSRGVANLTTLDKLEKTDVKVMGDFGKNVFAWRKV